MHQHSKKIERHQAIEQYGLWLLGELQEQGISLTVVGENALHIKGEMSAGQKEIIRLWKRPLIEALSPKCTNCGSPMKLIENNTLWFCPFGCGSFKNELHSGDGRFFLEG